MIYICGILRLCTMKQAMHTQAAMSSVQAAAVSLLPSWGSHGIPPSTNCMPCSTCAKSILALLMLTRCS